MVYPHTSVKSARNFAVHYGMNHLKALSEYDLAVVEPKAHHMEDIKILRNNATAVFGYISIFEIDPQQPEYEIFRSHEISEGVSTDTEKGRKRHFIDLRSGLWTEFLHSKVRKMLDENKYDGIFIDTLAYIEECVTLESVMFSQMLAVCDFLKKVRTDHPGAEIIQNNALGLTLNYTRDHIDAVCWENPPAVSPEQRKMNKLIISKLNKIKKENGIKVLILTEDTDDPKYFRQMADKNDFLYYDAPKDYIGPVR